MQSGRHLCVRRLPQKPDRTQLPAPPNPPSSIHLGSPGRDTPDECACCRRCRCHLARKHSLPVLPASLGLPTRDVACSGRTSVSCQVGTRGTRAPRTSVLHAGQAIRTNVTLFTRLMFCSAPWAHSMLLGCTPRRERVITRHTPHAATCNERVAKSRYRETQLASPKHLICSTNQTYHIPEHAGSSSSPGKRVTAQPNGWPGYRDRPTPLSCVC